MRLWLSLIVKVWIELFILFMLHLCQRISFCFTATQKYVLKDFKYLIEAPPKRPANSFGLFVKEKAQGKNGVNVTKQIKELSAAWKYLKPQDKAAYQNQFKTQLQAYKIIKAQYDSKVTTPFKIVNSTALFVQHLFKDKVITVKQNTPIAEYGKEMGKHMKERTPEQKAKYDELAKKAREENEKKTAAFAFPEKLYKSQSAFTRNHPKIKEEDRKKEYLAYEQKWRQDVQKWLADNKIDMTIEQFFKLYNRQLNKKRKDAKERREQSQNQTEQSEETSEETSEDTPSRKRKAKKNTKSSNAKRAKKSSR